MNTTTKRTNWLQALLKSKRRECKLYTPMHLLQAPSHSNVYHCCVRLFSNRTIMSILFVGSLQTNFGTICQSINDDASCYMLITFQSSLMMAREVNLNCTKNSQSGPFSFVCHNYQKNCRNSVVIYKPKTMPLTIKSGRVRSLPLHKPRFGIASAFLKSHFTNDNVSMFLRQCVHVLACNRQKTGR
jgi:hypothetical protein